VGKGFLEFFQTIVTGQAAQPARPGPSPFTGAGSNPKTNGGTTDDEQRA